MKKVRSSQAVILVLDRVKYSFSLSVVKWKRNATTEAANIGAIPSTLRASFFLKKNGIHSTQDWTVNTRYGFTKRRKQR